MAWYSPLRLANDRLVMAWFYGLAAVWWVLDAATSHPRPWRLALFVFLIVACSGIAGWATVQLRRRGRYVGSGDPSA